MTTKRQTSSQKATQTMLRQTGMSAVLKKASSTEKVPLDAWEYGLIPLKDIRFYDKNRNIIETPEQPLKRLEKSIDDLGFFDAITLRRMEEGKGKVIYVCLSGERRLRALHSYQKMDKVPALYATMTDRQAEKINAAANEVRLDEQEPDKIDRYKKDLDYFEGKDSELREFYRHAGMTEAAISKAIKVAQLPTGTEKLRVEGFITDIETLITLADIEAQDQGAFSELDIKIRSGESKGGLRKIVAKVKRSLKTGGQPMRMYRPKSYSDPVRAFKAFYQELAVEKDNAQDVAEEITRSEVLKDWLKSQYDSGKETKDLAADVINGFASGHFDKKGAGAFALATYLMGASKGKFDARLIAQKIAAAAETK